MINHAQLLADEAQYCSFGDTVHYVNPPKIFTGLMFAFEVGYHGRTLGASSYRYRRRFGHFGDRAQFIPFPYPFRRPKGMTTEEYSEAIVREFARKFENEYHAIWNPKTGQCEYAAFYVEPIQGTDGYVVPPANFFKGLKRCSTSTASCAPTWSATACARAPRPTAARPCA